MIMSDDKTLLELAAKAAGIELDWDIPPNARNPWRMTGVKGTEDYGPACEWNPLTDDGDALRLAVKLGLDVCIDSRQENEPHTHVIGFRDDNTSETIDAIENHGDPYAATRRAIVIAAAAIGESR